MSKIKFGTDGWRAIMADAFTFENVRVVTQAIASFVVSQDLAKRGLVIGHDSRFLSERFAEVVAEVLTGNGIPVWLTASPIPTPVTAFAIKHLNAAGAVMMTASHNPPEYHGIKFIPEYAGPALPWITDQIEEHVAEVLGGAEVRALRLDHARQQDMIRALDVKKPYLDHLRTVIDSQVIADAQMKVVVDPMFGAGVGYLDGFFQSIGLPVETIQGYRDPLFGGSMPEPSDRVLGKLKEKVLASGADLGLALDGDGDRFGIIDRDGTYITPNQVMVLLLSHLTRTRKWRGTVARTVATTHLLDRIARKLGLVVDETPVGFKYIGESMMKRDAFLGGEESGGLSVRGHLPEKDGILACALIAEVRAIQKKPLTEVLKDLYAEYGQLFSERLDFRTTPEDKARILEFIKSWQPRELAGQKVVDRLTIDGVKFNLADGAYALVRASGTEPLFRVYVEANSPEQLKTIQESMRQALNL